MSTSYLALFDPETDEPLTPGSVESEARLAGELLAETAGSNIHDHDEMIRAAVKLDGRLRCLVAALAEARGGVR